MVKQKTKFKRTEIGEIPEDWEVSTLDEISLKVTDGSHYSPKESEKGNKIIATVKDMEYYQFSFKNCKRIADEDFNLLVKNGCSPEKGDIIISKDGANCLDLIFVYNQDKKIVLLSSIAIVKLKKGFNPQFYRYYLLSPLAQKIMREGYVSGSAIPRVILTDFKKVPIPILPNIETQNKIADILSSLDDKIALNRSMNSTLEAIGQALFRRWFVDFEFPNEEGKPYRSSGGEMVETELGGVPRGWEAKPIDQIADFLNGLAMQKYPPKGEDYLPVIKIRELKQRTTESSDKASPEIDKKFIVNDGDILFSWSGSLEVCIWCGGRGALNQHLFKVTSQNYPKWFYYQWIKVYLPEFQHIAEGKATTMGHIQRHHLSNSFVAVPPNEIIEKANKLMNPLIERYINNAVESRNLSKIRDALLPKLMSGEIRINVDREVKNETMG